MNWVQYLDDTMVCIEKTEALVEKLTPLSLLSTRVRKASKND